MAERGKNVAGKGVVEICCSCIGTLPHQRIKEACVVSNSILIVRVLSRRAWKCKSYKMVSNKLDEHISDGKSQGLLVNEDW